MGIKWCYLKWRGPPATHRKPDQKTQSVRQLHLWRDVQPKCSCDNQDRATTLNNYLKVPLMNLLHLFRYCLICLCLRSHSSSRRERTQVGGKRSKEKDKNESDEKKFNTWCWARLGTVERYLALITTQELSMPLDLL